MSDEKFNPKFDIPLGVLEEKIHYHINKLMDGNGYDRIIPLRDLDTVDFMANFKKDLLHSLIGNIVLKDSDIKPYENSKIEVYGLEPRGFNVGQTFVLESKLIGILFDLQKKFNEFITKGISKLPPQIVYGNDYAGEKAMAFYMPPLIEIHPSDGLSLIDGAHRSFVCKGAGTTIYAVHIENVNSPLPFKNIGWDDVRVCSEKPPLEERYNELKPGLFRDLGSVGIDG